jgi:hypothetical protein
MRRLRAIARDDAIAIISNLKPAWFLQHAREKGEI